MINSLKKCSGLGNTMTLLFLLGRVGRRIYRGGVTDLGSRNDSGLNAKGGFSELGQGLVLLMGKSLPGVTSKPRFWAILDSTGERERGGRDARRVLLCRCSLAFTRYCHRQYCMVYGIQRRGRWGGVYCAMVVQ